MKFDSNFFFFFSSRRRHTRFDCDWSSDVCSSDLLLNYTDRNVIFALFEPIKRELVLSDQQLGWLGSAYVIVLSLAALPLGVLGDLKSRRAVIAFGVGLWSAFTALGATGSRFWQLLVCR